jgi:hypothetical protein
MKFRFVVGVPEVSQSSSWKLWTQGNETYMLTRQTGGDHKFLHRPSLASASPQTADLRLLSPERVVMTQSGSTTCPI